MPPAKQAQLRAKRALCWRARSCSAASWTRCCCAWSPCCLAVLRRVCTSMRTQVDASIQHLTARRPVLVRDINAAGRRWPNTERLVFSLDKPPARMLAAAAAVFTKLKRVELVRAEWGVLLGVPS